MKWYWSVLGLTVIVGALGLAGCDRTGSRGDAQVAAEVQANLQRDALGSGRGVEVLAQNGVVTLNGTVASDHERGSAAIDAARVEGVRTVINNLVVQQAQSNLPPEQAPSEVTGPAKASLPARRSAKLPPAHPVAPAHSQVAAAVLNSPAAPTEPVVTQVPPPPPPPKKIAIPAGTQFSIRLNEPLDTERNQVGDAFHATLGAPIVVDSETAIPSGADVVGRVVDVKSAGRFAGNSVLTLELNSLSVNGKTYNIQTNQWTREGKGEGKNTAIKAGGGAAVGAIIGGLAGGGKGAAIGSVAGAGAGTGAAATKKGEQIKLAPEATLSFLLINTVTVIQQPTNSHNEGRTPLP